MRRSILFILLPVIGLCKGMLTAPKSPNTLLVDCPPPVTLTEGMKYDTSVTGAPKVTQNNGGAVTITWLEVYQKGDCKNHADVVTRIFTVSNAMGEQVRCNQYITIKHLSPNEIYFPSDTTLDYPDSLSTLTQKLLPGIPKTLGSVKITFFDTRVSPNCNQPVRIRRQWSLEDLCTGQIRSVTTFMNLHKYINNFKQFTKQSEAICVDDGFIELTPVGEFIPYTYKWNTGDSVPAIYNRTPGLYTVTVTDRFGCSANQVYNLLSMSQRADIGGKISTDIGIRVVPDSLVFENQSLISKFCISQQSGIHYGFTLKTRKTGQYNYRFVKNSDPKAGISTKDILLIQRHILNLSRFTDTLQWIAADVNYNFNITASDISEIRRLLLGIKENFSVVKPWYFLRNDWRSIAKPNKPIADIEFKGVNVPNFPLTNVDVFVLKMGDIDLSYNGLQNTTVQRGTKSDGLILEWNSSNPPSAEHWIPVYLKSKQPVQGLQFKLIDPGNDELQIKNGQLDEQFIHTNENSLTVSWSTGSALDWNPDLPLFYVNASHAENLSQDPEFISEWYDADLNAFDLKINKGTTQIPREDVHFFYPNPTDQNIRFNFNFEKLEVNLYQIDGKLLLNITLFNNQELKIQHLPSGLYLISCKQENGYTRNDLLQIK